ncbi:MAG: phage tail protein [Cyanophyceae cyanobacterium]
MAQDELLVNCRFYFEADGITDKMILEVGGLSSESPPAGSNGVFGVSKDAAQLRQPTPTSVKTSPITVKVVATTNTDLYQWYAACNKNMGGASEWESNLKACSITVYDQAGTMKARWEIQEAYPSKYEGPNLTATGNDLANETLTLQHIGVERVL